MGKKNSYGTEKCEPKWPFQIHESHTAVYIGGYAVFLKCGSTRSCDIKSNTLRAQCRGWCPKATKAKILRTLEGKPPVANSELWPDGSKNPCVQQLRHACA